MLNATETEKPLYRLSGILAGFSVIGSCLILISYALVPKIRKHPFSLIFFLSLCDFFLSLKYVATALYTGHGGSASLERHAIPCAMQSIASQFFATGSITWIGIISINIVISCWKPFFNSKKLTPVWHLWVWSYCLGTTLTMMFTHNWGRSGDGTCWIEESFEAHATNWFQLTFFVPLVISFVLGLAAIISFALRMDTQQSAERRRATNNLRIRLVIFIVCFFLCWIGPLLHRIIQYFQQTSGYTVLIYMDAIGVSIQGFVNAVVWLTNPTFFKGFREKVLTKIPLGAAASDSIPLLSALNEEGSVDIQQLDALFRQDLLNFILIGLNHSVTRVDEGEVAFITPDNVNAHDVVFVYRDFYKTPRSNAKQNWSFKDYSPNIFERLRALDGISKEHYLSALSAEAFARRAAEDKFSEGRSASLFFFTPNNNFIIKTIEEPEANTLRRILPSYFSHLYHNRESLITRIYGLHCLKLQSGLRLFVMIMGNLFFTRTRIHEKYDLKGSWVARSVAEHAMDRSVLGKDSNLNRRLILPAELKQRILPQIEKDANYLASQGIMDYSLLVGFSFLDRDDANLFELDDVSEEGSRRLLNGGFPSRSGRVIYFLGIIDILQTFDWNKKLEQFWKVKILRKDQKGLSVQDVDTYLRRFWDAMQSLFVDDGDENEEERETFSSRRSMIFL